MNIIRPYVLVDKVNPESIMQDLEYKGRVCYKSEDRIRPGTATHFVKQLIKRGHESVLEHVSIGARFIVDRGVSHEIVRHRIGSYSHESTRYCDYSTQGITCIRPWYFEENPEALSLWERACRQAEEAYQKLRARGVPPQEARAVLPHSLKTELEVTYNLREWRHFLRLRADKSAHPQMRQVAIPLLLHFRTVLPQVFGDIDYDVSFPPKHYAEVITRRAWSGETEASERRQVRARVAKAGILCASQVCTEECPNWSTCKYYYVTMTPAEG